MTRNLALSEMSVEEKSRWIAEKIEPFASLPPLPDELVVGCDRMLGPVCWEAVSIYSEGDIPRWQQRDMVNDPAMTVMLLTELRAEGLVVTITPIKLNANLVILQVERYGGVDIVALRECDPLGLAVADAFMLANGYQENQ